MGKRIAEKQLTNLNVNEEDSDDENQEGTFQKASEEELAQRQIKQPKGRFAKLAGQNAKSSSSAFAGFAGLTSEQSNGSTSSLKVNPFATLTNYGAPASSAEPLKFNEIKDKTTTPFGGFNFAASTPSANTSNVTSTLLPPAPVEFFKTDSNNNNAVSPTLPKETPPPATGGFQFKFSTSSSSATTPSLFQPNPSSFFAKPTDLPPAFTFGKTSNDTASKFHFEPHKAEPSSPIESTGKEEPSKSVFGSTGFSFTSKSVGSDDKTSSIAHIPKKDIPSGIFSFKPSENTTGFSFKPSETTVTTSSSSKSSFEGFSSNMNGVGKSTTFPFKAPSIDRPKTPESLSDQRREEYYVQLRGLNVSLQSHITAQLNRDPFVDVSGSLNEYLTHRNSIMAKYGDVVSTPATPAPPKGLTFGSTTPNFQPNKFNSTTPLTAPEAPKFSFGPSFASQPASTSFGTGFTGFKDLNKSSAIPTETGQTKFSSAGDDDEDEVPDEEGFSGERTNSELVKTGEGEEEEVTLLEQRCRVYRMEKGADGDGWKDLGIGLFKVNEDKNTKKRRLLCRSEGNGIPILNINMFAEMKFTQTKSQVTFLAFQFNNGVQTLVHYGVKFANPDSAKDIRDKLEMYTPAKE